MDVSAGRFNYVEIAKHKNGREYRLSTIKVSNHLTAVLGKANQPVPFNKLVEVACEHVSDTSWDEGVAFINDLIENQLLLPDIEPPLTGSQPLDSLIEFCSSHSELISVRDTLRRFESRIRAIDRNGVGNSLESYIKAASELSSLPVAPNISKLFHVMRLGQLPLASDLLNWS